MYIYTYICVYIYMSMTDQQRPPDILRLKERGRARERDGGRKLCIYIEIYIYVCAYVCIYVHLYIHTSDQRRPRHVVHLRERNRRGEREKYIHIWKYTNIYVPVHIHTYICTYIYTRTYMHFYIYHIYSNYIDMYVYMYI